jgi:hypothetical protein
MPLITGPQTNQFDLALQIMEELTPEIEAARASSLQTTRLPELPTLDTILTDLGPLPQAALFMGIARDGLPVLLNLHDPAPGPVLITGDGGAGKTAFLQTMAQASAIMHGPQDVQFGVVTNFPDEWNGFEQLSNCVGVFPAYHTASSEFLLSLVSWGHSNKGGKQSVLLLVDGLENLTGTDFEVQQNLRWLLLRGPARRVWPLVTLNAGKAPELTPWLEAFRTRIFGYAHSSPELEALTTLPNAQLDSLVNGVQFAMQEGRSWLRFWLPSNE